MVSLSLSLSFSLWRKGHHLFPSECWKMKDVFSSQSPPHQDNIEKSRSLYMFQAMTEARPETPRTTSRPHTVHLGHWLKKWKIYFSFSLSLSISDPAERVIKKDNCLVETFTKLVCHRFGASSLEGGKAAVGTVRTVDSSSILGIFLASWLTEPRASNTLFKANSNSK